MSPRSRSRSKSRSRSRSKSSRPARRPPAAPPAPTPRRRPAPPRSLLLLLLAALLPLHPAIAADDPPPPPAQTQTQPQPPAADAHPEPEPEPGLAALAAIESAMIAAIERAEASVVAIARYRDPANPEETTAIRGRGPAPAPRVQPGVLRLDPEFEAPPDGIYGFGSGVVIGDAGEILTTYHNVSGASRLIVRAAGNQRFDAEIIAADPRSDLAVIAPRLAGPDAPSLKPIPLGDAGALRKGSFLIALGNSFDVARDDGRVSAGWGILANRARKIQLPPADDVAAQPQLRNYPTLLQLDAKLNLGMSGGAVVNLRGELVGLTTAAGNPENFDPQAGYAIPVDRLGRQAIDALRQGREVEYGFLGIRLDTLTRTTRIDSVTPGTPASQGGLMTGDEILEVGGVPVNDSDELVLAINQMPVGETIPLRVRRNGQTLERSVILSKMRILGDPPVIATTKPKDWRGLRVDFTSAVFNPADPALLQQMSKGTVSVSEVQNGSPAFFAGLRPGMIVLEVDGQTVASPRLFEQAVRDKTGPVKFKTDSGEIVVKP